MRTEKIGVGGGCHWCTEAVFQFVNGIVDVKQGWISSIEPYDSFSEAVIVEFHPEIISLAKIIEIHLHTHSSTANHSMRKKYRSAVYFEGNAQELSIKKIMEELNPDFDHALITQVLPFSKFKLNNDKFLNYYRNNPQKAFCQTRINPKLAKVRQNFFTYYQSNLINK